MNFKKTILSLNNFTKEWLVDKILKKNYDTHLIRYNGKEHQKIHSRVFR